jgi:hypothetical protein
MVIFDRKFTEVIFFDIECYVPPEDQLKIGKSSLVFNAGNPNHFVLGGVFKRMFPMTGATEESKQFWSFDKRNEKTTLAEIYQYFNKSWEMIDARNRKKNPDLILIGCGIARHDIPALFLRSLMNNVAPSEDLYETYFKTKVVDLGEAAIPIFIKSRDVYPFYPKTVDELLTELQIKSTKSSGMGVWKMYEAGDYEGIKRRTNAEVEDIVAMANALIKRCGC